MSISITLNDEAAEKRVNKLAKIDGVTPSAELLKCAIQGISRREALKTHAANKGTTPRKSKPKAEGKKPKASAKPKAGAKGGKKGGKPKARAKIAGPKVSSSSANGKAEHATESASAE